MTEVAGGQAGVLLVNLPCEKDVFAFEGPNFHAVPSYQCHCTVKCLTAAYPQVRMRQFLQDLRGSA